MGFVLVLFGVVLLITAMRGTVSQLGSLLLSDFQGKNNFGIWLFAFFVIGSLGYFQSFKKFSDAFLLLVIVVILIANDKDGHSFFGNLQSVMNGQVQATSTAANTGAFNSSVPGLSPLPSLVST